MTDVGFFLEHVQKGGLRESLNHQVNESNLHEGVIALESSFIRFGKPTGAIEPTKSSFDEPALGLNLKATSRP